MKNYEEEEETERKKYQDYYNVRFCRSSFLSICFLREVARYTCSVSLHGIYHMGPTTEKDALAIFSDPKYMNLLTHPPRNQKLSNPKKGNTREKVEVDKKKRTHKRKVED